MVEKDIECIADHPLRGHFAAGKENFPKFTAVEKEPEGFFVEDDERSARADLLHGPTMSVSGWRVDADLNTGVESPLVSRPATEQSGAWKVTSGLKRPMRVKFSTEEIIKGGSGR